MLSDQVFFIVHASYVITRQSMTTKASDLAQTETNGCNKWSVCRIFLEVTMNTDDVHLYCSEFLCFQISCRSVWTICGVIIDKAGNVTNEQFTGDTF